MHSVPPNRLNPRGMARAMVSRKQTLYVGLGLLLSALAVFSARAANMGDVGRTSKQWLTDQVESQKRVDALSDEGRNLGDTYRATLRETEGLKLYLQQLRAQLKSQEQEMETLRAEAIELDRTNVEVMPFMQRMLTSLEQFVALDVPFLKGERQARVAKLKEMMPRADVTVSEKFRRIVEAYQIEMEYGRTIEAYRAPLKDKEVDYLRVGRVALVYQTPDGDETGYWDVEKKDWVVDDDYAEGVTEGLKVARKQTSPNLLVVPVQAALGRGK